MVTKPNSETPNPISVRCLIGKYLAISIVDDKQRGYKKSKVKIEFL